MTERQIRDPHYFFMHRPLSLKASASSYSKKVSFSLFPPPPTIKRMTTHDNEFNFLPLLASDKNQGRILHVSHQIPFEITHDIKEDQRLQWSFTSRHEHAAMYAGMHSMADEWETLCLGWSGQMYENSNNTTEDFSRHEIDPTTLTPTEKEAIATQLLEQQNCIPLFLDNESIAGHYHGYCKTCKCFGNTSWTHVDI